MNKELIAQEIALAAREVPDGLQRVRKAIQQGKLIATAYVSLDCGCFYGHLVGLDHDEAERIAHEMSMLFTEIKSAYTPVEQLLADKHEEGRLDEALQIIDEAIAAYLGGLNGPGIK